MKREHTLLRATDLLREDHERIRALFQEYDIVDKEERADIVCKVCRELRAHTSLEEEFFYPSARRALSNKEIVQEAEEEHQEAKRLMADLDDMQPGDEDFQDTFKQLMEDIRHHIQEEEAEMFPMLETPENERKLEKLGRQLEERRRNWDEGSAQRTAFSNRFAGSSAEKGGLKLKKGKRRPLKDW